MVNNKYRLKSVKLHNFRCYGEDDQLVQFGKECTVIIGYNGAGKTALLSAIKKAASFILSKDRRQTYKFIGDGKDIRESSLRVEDVRYTFDTGIVDEDYHYPCRVSLDATVLGNDLHWVYEKPDKRTTVDKMLFRPMQDVILSQYTAHPNETILPLLSYFSDSYPHVRASLTKYEKDVIVNKTNNIERRAGYYRWDANSTDFYFWRDLFCSALRRVNHSTSGLTATRDRMTSENIDESTLNALKKHESSLLLAQKQIDYIKAILKEFSKTYATHDNADFEIVDISEGSYLEEKKEVFTLMLHFKNGHDRLFDMLPEGHKRLLAIAFEIAYRFFILNRQAILEDSSIKPEGLVIIDELELHLHPTLAQEALIRFRDTFPGVQFIVSTHSPAVISNVRNDGDIIRILSLDSDHNFTEVEDCFGCDYSDTLVMHMGSYGRMHLLSIFEELYREYKAENDQQGMNEIKEQIKAFWSNSENADQWATDLIESWI